MFAGGTHPRFSFRIQIPDSFPLTDRIDGKYSKSFFHIIENHMLIGLTPEPGLGVSAAKQDRRKGFFRSGGIRKYRCDKVAGSGFKIEFLDDDTISFYRSEEHTSELQSRGHLVCR